ncbi:MAG: phosphoadenylyl-sulfate reductase [Bacteroidota bacterium]|nr:phosphoadenylyl-sulfate reductase [Bacteroidota bacterium]MDP4248113.1 phosphoadenylyl-sulfate reductase [Bacteroidota bacterium]MDP4254728.1 phosphoadenylyl-sulfate reductase [Bacteroidota bacterium]MDP4259239.1 phosphoadenylyl-sulfate reductase [Bacteroidota bacterium]
MDQRIPIQEQLPGLLDQVSRLTIRGALELLSSAFPGQVVFSTSFSAEDQVVAHEILSAGLPIRVFTLDTGRLFAETYSVWTGTNEKYGTRIEAYYPDRALLEPYLNERGPNAFYESVANRKDCCHIRKVEPLKRALRGNAVWITGLRAEHSPERRDHRVLEWDEGNGVIKYNPLLDWDTAAVRAFIDRNDIPYNTLHDRGFVSIGCAPCTRAIRAGEDFRAGRWWWEDSAGKECGLHVTEEKATSHS